MNLDNQTSTIVFSSTINVSLGVHCKTGKPNFLNPSPYGALGLAKSLSDLLGIGVKISYHSPWDTGIHGSPVSKIQDRSQINRFSIDIAFIQLDNAVLGGHKGVLEFLERTLKLPLKVIQPFHEEKPKEKNNVMLEYIFHQL